MAKLTVSQKRMLNAILGEIARARKYIMDDNIAICRRRGMATTTLDYVSPKGDALTPVVKDYGSNLCALSDAVQHLTQFIDTN